MENLIATVLPPEVLEPKFAILTILPPELLGEPRAEIKGKTPSRE